IDRAINLLISSLPRDCMNVSSKKDWASCGYRCSKRFRAFPIVRRSASCSFCPSNGSFNLLSTASAPRRRRYDATPPANLSARYAHQTTSAATHIPLQCAWCVLSSAAYWDQADYKVMFTSRAIRVICGFFLLLTRCPGPLLCLGRLDRPALVMPCRGVVL